MRQRRTKHARIIDSGRRVDRPGREGARATTLIAAVVVMALASIIAACELDPPAGAVRTFEIRVEFDGGLPGSYTATFDAPAGLSFTDDGSGVFTSGELNYADFDTTDSAVDPAIIRVSAQRADTSQRLEVIIYQRETYMTPPGEQILKEEVYEAAGTEGASENPSLDIDLALAVPGS